MLVHAFRALEHAHLRGLALAVGTGRDHEFHLGVFVEALVAVALNLAEMDEQVFAVLLGDEAVTFFRAEPLNRTVPLKSESVRLLPFPALPH